VEPVIAQRKSESALEKTNNRNTRESEREVHTLRVYNDDESHTNVPSLA
jgi:hypothetical protein